MRRAVVASTLLAAAACGNFLGLGSDDDVVDPPPASGTDAGDDGSTSADGAALVDALPPGCQRHVITFTGVGDVDAAVGQAGWQQFSAGSATLAIEDNRLVVRSLGSPEVTADQANVSFRRDGNVVRITCTTEMQVSSFAVRSRFVWLRLFGDQWTDYYSAYGEVASGELRAPTQSQYADGGERVEHFPRGTPPAANTVVPLFVELVADPPTFEVRVGETIIRREVLSPSPTNAARVIFGAFTPSSADAGAFETRFGDIECVSCVAQ